MIVIKSLQLKWDCFFKFVQIKFKLYMETILMSIGVLKLMGDLKLFMNNL